MRDASLHSWRPGFTRAVLVGGLLLAGLGVLSLAEAAPPAKGGSDKTTGKNTAATAKTKAPTSLKIASIGESSDVGEVSKIINDRLEASWKANKITPSAYADDYDFIRRSSLDIIGRIASSKDIQQFFAKTDKKGKVITPETRRSAYIEYLLSHEDYPRHWANLWSNWLLTRAGDFGKGKYHEQMTVWLEDQFAQNKPYDEMVTKLLTSSGKNTDNGAVNFFLAHLGEPIPNGKQREEGQFEMVPLTSRITRVFLGTQVQCAQCHAHPFFNALKQESFWGVNAFLRQIRREGVTGNRPRMGALPDLTLKDDESVNPDASVFFEMRNGKVKMWHAEFLGIGGKERGQKLDPKKTGVARREELAKYLIEHDMFTKAMVNRMWGLLFGRGFVNPIDDFNDNNQPSNPELLNEVASKFKHYGYDMKKLIRWITHSQAYHLSHVANSTNDKAEHETQFSRMILKALSPEQLFESLMTATASEKAMAPAEKKKLRDEWLDRLVNNFGDDEGNEVNFNGTIVQALLMMNGKNINDAIGSARAVGGATSLAKSPAVIVRDIYLTALNRPPRASEMTNVMNKMRLRAGFKDTSKAMYEDLFWALLNSNEFLLNH